jgi:DNA-binding MarR family transcriptional regulator
MADHKTDPEYQRIAAMPQTCVNHNLRRAARIVSNSYDEVLRGTGLHANQLIMLVVVYLYEPAPINAMAEGIGLDRTTLVRDLRLIEEQGLITIRPGEHDRRQRLVSLTPKGRDTLIGCLPIWEQAQKKVVDVLGLAHGEFMLTLASLEQLEEET